MTDIDLMRHMNNAAYFRYAEPARHAWFLSIDPVFKDKQLSMALLAQSIKYRRECKAGETFVVRTRACHWDQCNVYFKHEFIHKQTHQVHCIILVRFGLLRNGRLVKRIGDDTDEQGGFYSLRWYRDMDGHDERYSCRDEMDESLKAWISHMELLKRSKL